MRRIAHDRQMKLEFPPPKKRTELDLGPIQQALCALVADAQLRSAVYFVSHFVTPDRVRVRVL